MNTYNDNLLTAITGTLSTIAAEQAQQNSEQTVAQYNLYYAVGSQLLAQDKLKKVNVEFDKTMDINDQGVANTNQASDLMDYAQITDQNVTAVVANTATVAQNVQAVSNAILKLASNIGSAKNLVSASDYDTDLQRMTEYANEVINKTAYQSELTSQLAMEASTIASQIISKQVLLDVTATKALFDDMGKRTQAELTSLTDARIADTNRLIAANTAQQSAEGRLKKTAQQYLATTEAYATSNLDLNFDLKVDDIERDRIKVSFDPLEHPFSDNHSKNKNGTQYYITVVKASIKDSFSFDIAEGFFNEHKDKRFLELSRPPYKNVHVTLESGSLNSQIDSLIKSLDTESKQALCDTINEILDKTENDKITPEYISDANRFQELMADYYKKKNKKVPDNLGEFLVEIKTKMPEKYLLEDYHGQRLYMDSDGEKIETGTSYVIFLYMELDKDYKKEINNFSDRMSAASNAFTLTSKLKAAGNIAYKPADGADSHWGSITFDVDGKNHSKTEYRCIFLPSWSTSQDTCVGTNDAPVKIWFNLEMAKRISATNYTKIDSASGVPNTQQDGIVSYEVPLSEKTTDNFGQLIAKGLSYIPVILSIIPESTIEKDKPLADSYTPEISSLDVTPIELLPLSESKKSGAVQVNTAPKPNEEKPAPAPQPVQPAPAPTPVVEAAQTSPAASEPARTEHSAIHTDNAPKK